MSRRERTSKASARGAVLLGALLLASALPVSPAFAEVNEGDRWEGMNRSIFAFNEWLDRSVMMPVAKAWDFVLPEPAQTAVDNLYETYGMPIVLGNDILQLKPLAAGQDLARVVVNCTVGIVGLFDVATQIGIPQNDEDFGQTLGYWGVPMGPFLMLPLFGPSNIRDTFGLIADFASQPVSYFAPFYATLPGNVVAILNRRAIFLEEVDDARDASLDYYSFQRNAYVQSRTLAVDDLDAPEEETEEDLYYFEGEEE